MDKTFSPSGKLVFLRVSRLGRLPPALYAAELLAEKGVPVLAIEYGNATEERREVPGLVPRLRMPFPPGKFLPGGLKTLACWSGVATSLALRFRREGKPRLVLAEGLQEQAMAYALGHIAGIEYGVQVHEVYDGHELSRVNQLFLSTEANALGEARFTVFPEANRAGIYKERYRLTREPLLAFNCPRLRTPRRPSPARAAWKLPPDALVLAYVGGIGRGNGLEAAIGALSRVPRIHFFAWGWGDKTYTDELLWLAKDLGVGDRFRLAGELDADKWECLDASDIGYCVYERDELRRRHQATASNKLMESFAAGCPVITTGSPDFAAITIKKDVGECTEEITADSVANALERLTKDETSFRRRAENALRLHRTEYHFEHQFQPVVERLSQWFPELGEKAKKSSA